MKKFLVLTLALLLALAVAAPAMAFTSNTSGNNGAIPFELDIYLVDYEDNDFFGLTTLPATDRGYAKNEVVAVIAELYVPKGEDPGDDEYGYDTIDFTGDNVNFDVTDNTRPLRTVNVDKSKLEKADYTKDDDAVTIAIEEGDLYNKSKNVTYKWLAFAKVTGDDASITFGLRATGTGFVDFEDNDLKAGIDLGDYFVIRKDLADGHTYTIREDDNSGDKLFVISVDKKYKSTGLEILLKDGTSYTSYTVVGLKNGNLGFIAEGAGTLEDDKHIISDLMDIFEDVFEDDFGFDFDLMGGVVNDDFFLDYLGSDDIEVTVEIKPWTAYVSIPDVVVIDPPKTGDAASVLGFVMVALAALAAFAVKKVRA